MKFPDKLTPNGQLEQYSSGESTDRFVIIAETRKEFESVRASLSNVALVAFQSESSMEPEDARILLDFMRMDRYQQARLTVHFSQAERLARLIRLGASSVMPEIIENQFSPYESSKADEVSAEELTRVAIGVAEDVSIEADTRKFRKEIETYY
jgi:hypothetical protein